MSSAVSTTVTVTGMTCGGCANRVREAVGRIPEVTGVTVDVSTGAVTVDSAAPVERDSIAAAVGAAGYGLTD